MSNVITQILNQFTTDSDTYRQTAQESRMDVYLDDYEQQVKSLLKDQFAPENRSVLYPMMAKFDNVLKKIVNLKAMNYKDVPKRSWMVNGEADDTFGDILKNSNLDSESITIEKFAHVNNIAFNRIKIIDGRLYFEAVAPENITIEQDDRNPWQFNALHHRIVKNSTRGEMVQSFHLWTNGKSSLDDGEFPSGYFQMVRIDGKGDEQMGEKQPNPYVDPETGLGIIPYAEIRTCKGVDYWAETINNDLYYGTLQINVLQTYLNHLMKMASYRQLFATGKIDTKVLSGQKLDPTTLINIEGVPGGAQPTIQSLEITKDPNQLLNAINRQKAILADNHGVSFSADAMSGQRQTAEAMTINRQQILDMRKDVLPLFREYEHDLAWKIVTMANTPTNLNGLGLSIDVNGEFEIDYQEPKFITDPKADFELDLLKMNQGIINKADMIIKYNPDVKTTEAAIEQAEKNREITAEIDGTPGAQDNEIEQAVQGINIIEPVEEETP